MCRRARWGLTLAWCLAQVAGSASASAQETEEELVRRIDSLRPVLEEAARAADEAVALRAREEAARSAAVVETVQVGPLRIVTLPGQAELAAQLFDEVWREDFEVVTGSPSLARHVFTFSWWRGNVRQVPQVQAVDGAEVASVKHVEVSRRWVRTRVGVKDHIRDAIWAALREDFPEGSPMHQWLSWSHYKAPADVYRVFALTPSPVIRACLSDEGGACAATLGLDLTSARDRLPEWFTERERWIMVAMAAGSWTGWEDRDDPVVRDCLEDEDIAQCDQLLVDRLGWSGSVSTPSEAKVHMLLHAIWRGGDGAWQRAMERPSATPAEILAHVSGLGDEVLVASWRASLLEQRPDAYAGLGTTAGSVFFWVLVLAAFAMRSTRWRLG